MSLLPATIAAVLLLSYGLRFGYSPMEWIGVTAVLALIAAASAAREVEAGRDPSA